VDLAGMQTSGEDHPQPELHRVSEFWPRTARGHASRYSSAWMGGYPSARLP
jgi:hypothetical protein